MWPRHPPDVLTPLSTEIAAAQRHADERDGRTELHICALCAFLRAHRSTKLGHQLGVPCL